MSKFIFWIVVVFAILFGLRLLNAAKARRRADESRRTDAAVAREPESMVRCVRCGVFLPRKEAKPVAGGHACTDAQCARSR